MDIIDIVQVIIFKVDFKETNVNLKIVFSFCIYRY